MLTATTTSATATTSTAASASSANRATPSESTPSVPCQFHLVGRCMYGPQCRYSHSEAAMKSIPLCMNHIARVACPYGYSCRFAHGQLCQYCRQNAIHPWSTKEEHWQECAAYQQAYPPAVEPPAVEDPSTATPVDTCCSICLEDLHATADAKTACASNMQRRYAVGILLHCSHVFCYNCIATWRGAHAKKNHDEDEDDGGTLSTAPPKETARSCPNCRKFSEFVVPSTVVPQSDAHRLAIIDAYKKQCKAKPCRNLEETGSCPFRNECLYAHLDSSGKPVILPERPRPRPRSNARNRRRPTPNLHDSPAAMMLELLRRLRLEDRDYDDDMFLVQEIFRRDFDIDWSEFDQEAYEDIHEDYYDDSEDDYEDSEEDYEDSEEDHEDSEESD